MIYSLHPTMQGLLGNLKNPNMQGLLWFFLKSDASGIGGAIIYHMHASGVKAHAESNQICNKRWLFFSQEKLIMGVFPLVFEPSKNRSCIVGWREYCLTWSPLSFVKSQSSTTYLSTSNLVTIRGLQFLVSCTACSQTPAQPCLLVCGREARPSHHY